MANISKNATSRSAGGAVARGDRKRGSSPSVAPRSCLSPKQAPTEFRMPVVSPAPAPKSNLRPPWQKGQSGNPAGYPRQYAEVVKLARGHTERAIERLAELLESNDERVATVAAQAMLDRGWGLPREFPDASESTSAPEMDFSYLTLQERGQFMQLWQKLVSGKPEDRDEAKQATRKLLGLK